MTTNSNDLVVKDNKLVESSYHLDLIEQRIILLAITEARKQQKTITAKDFTYIYAKDYAETYKVPMNQAYEALIESADKLYSRSVRIRRDDLSKLNTIDIRWLSAKGSHNGTGTLGLRFTQDVIPLITKLEKQFTKYRLEYVAMMTSPYAIRLYELLIQWNSVGKREVEIDWLKEILQLTGHYTAVKDFKKYVIDVAVAQINAHSDLTVEYTQRKTGRNVTHIIFAFKKKEEQKPVIEVVVSAVETKQEEDACFSTATIKISRANQAKFLKLRTPDEIRQCIAIANQNIMDVEKKGAKIRNLSAYYATAIRDGWHLEQKEQQKKQEQNNQEEVKKREQIASAIEAACRARGIHELNIYNRAHGIPLINL